VSSRVAGRVANRVLASPGSSSVSERCIQSSLEAYLSCHLIGEGICCGIFGVSTAHTPMVFRLLRSQAPGAWPPAFLVGCCCSAEGPRRLEVWPFNSARLLARNSGPIPGLPQPASLRPPISRAKAVGRTPEFQQRCSIRRLVSAVFRRAASVTPLRARTRSHRGRASGACGVSRWLQMAGRARPFALGEGERGQESRKGCFSRTPMAGSHCVTVAEHQPIFSYRLRLPDLTVDAPLFCGPGALVRGGPGLLPASPAVNRRRWNWRA